MTRRTASFAAGVGAIALVLSQSTIWAQATPNLGTAHRFGLLGNSGVTGSTGTGTVVSGDVGSFPTGSISNFPPSTVATGFVLHTTANAIVQQAQTDARTAYNFLAAQGGTTINDNLATVGALTPGVYAINAADLPATSVLTLNGSGIFIFNVASSLTMNVGSSIAGSANPCNIYWRVGTSATLNGTSFRGTVIADANITIGGGNVVGRALAGTGATGAVTIPGSGGNTVGGCSDPLVAPTVSKAFSPVSVLPGVVSRLTITLNNPNATAITLTAALTDTLPAGVLIAATPTVATTCAGAASATAGGTTVSLAAGSTLLSGSCTVAVNVTAAVPGSYINTIPIGGLQTIAGNNAAPASATLAVTCPVITLAPLTMPGGVVGVPYSQTVTASGGTPPYGFTVTTGTLPAGLTLTSAGVLAGTPTTTGSSTVTVRGTDANGCFADVAYTIVIAAAPVSCPAITLAPLTLPNGTIGVAYSQTITATGGTAPYAYSLTSGALPAGLTLTTAGVVAGTPTTAGTHTFTVRGTDSLGCFGELVYTVSIPALPSVPTMTQWALAGLAGLLLLGGAVIVRSRF
jgi:hypothetical protein